MIDASTFLDVQHGRWCMSPPEAPVGERRTRNVFAAFWAILILAVIGLIAWASRSSRGPGSQAKRILSQRVAAGYTSAEEYRERLATMSEDPSAGGGTRWMPIAIVGGLIVLIVAAIAWTGWGSWGWMGDGWGTMGDHMGFSSSASGANVDALPDAGEVTVEAGEMFFEPNTLTVTAGESVNLTLDNTGTAFHDLTIPALDVTIDAQPGERATAGIAPEEPGTCEFFCSVPGHANAGMTGELIVEAT